MKDLIEINKKDFDVELDIRYATNNNVIGNKIYDHPFCYLRKEAAEKLEESIKLAKIQGCRFKIFDCLRPFSAQKYLFEKYPDGDFVSDPSTGSIPHCRGVAIDLTLIDANNQELNMGTEFDNFTPLAYHGSTKVDIDAQKNRYILMGIMMSSGWDFYKKEWWHYQLFNACNYDVVDEKIGNQEVI